MRATLVPFVLALVWLFGLAAGGGCGDETAGEPAATTSGAGASGGNGGEGAGAKGGAGAQGGAPECTPETEDADCGADSDCRANACVEGACDATFADQGDACDDGMCTTAPDCLCDGGGECVNATCMDALQNADETDVDCGGSCPECENGKTCLAATDCESGFCESSGAGGSGGGGGTGGGICAPCSDHGDCDSASFCDPVESACVPDVPLGTACSDSAVCQGDQCVDGYCCDDECVGGCDVCDDPNALGTCTVLSDGDAGDGSCSPYLCNGTSGGCPTSCAGNQDCIMAGFCNPQSQCEAVKLPLGQTCSVDSECLSGNCVDGVCCNVTAAACAGSCQACNVQGNLGTCSSEPSGTACNDNSFCNGSESCDGVGNCSVSTGNPCPGPDGDGDCSETCNEATDSCTLNDPNGTPCTDGAFCNGTETCNAGVCANSSGNPCPGSDGDGNCAESCNEQNDTCTGNDPNGSPCTDGAFCNGTETCNAGVCANSSGNPCPGPDGDGNCAESCNEAADNCTANDPNGAACTDGAFCNGTETCNGGVCANSSGNPCPGPDGDGDCSEACNEAADNCTANDPNGSACADGLFCNGTETCVAGSCANSTGDPCPGADGDGNCAESCNESSDACNAADPNGSMCSDGLFCNGLDSCAGGSCNNHSGDPCSGPDGDGNCVESCNESSDACNAPDPNGSACTDGLFCNGLDSCTAGSCTAHSGEPCAGPDGDGNCAESCNESADTCTAFDPNGSSCSDGLFCTGTDTCSGGTCSNHSGDPCPGADGDGNCAESCNESGDSCNANDPNGSVCTDGSFCNGADTCGSGTCSVHVGNPCPGADGDGNCSESCDEGADNCSAPDPNGAACSDGTFCNGTEACNAGTCGSSSGNPCPGPDGDGNCAESCNESADNCSALDPNGAACSDGTFCNGTEACNAGICGGSSGNPCSGPDGDGNCAESCSESADSCTAPDPPNTPCTDGQFCTLVDQCNGNGLCVGNGNPCPGADGDINCAESCNEAADNCTLADPNGAACNDGQLCTATDGCQNGSCVGSGMGCSGSFIWSKGMGSSGLDVAHGVATDPSGNVYVTGKFTGTVDFGGGPLTSAGADDIFLVSYDAAGAHRYSARFGDASLQSAAAIAVNEFGEVVIVGSFFSTVNFGGATLVSQGAQDIFVAKFNQAGGHVWSQRYGDNFPQFAEDVAFDTFGDLVIVGSFQSTVSFGGSLLSSMGANDMFIAKLGGGGNHQWSQRFGDSSQQLGLSVVVDSVGSITVAGYFQGIVSYGGGSLFNSTPGTFDLVLAQYHTSNGSHFWSQALDADQVTAYPLGLGIDSFDHVFLTGTFEGFADFGGGLLASAGSGDMFVAKYTPFGSHLWSAGYGDSALDQGDEVIADPDGNVVVVGQVQGALDFGGGLLLTAGGSLDVAALKLDANGVHVWSEIFGDASAQYGLAVASDASGNTFLAGGHDGSITFGGPTHVSTGSRDVFVAKLGP